MWLRAALGNEMREVDQRRRECWPWPEIFPGRTVPPGAGGRRRARSRGDHSGSEARVRRVEAEARVRGSKPSALAPPVVPSPPIAIARPYLSTDQLAELTPWSADAIEKMVARGILCRGVHYFQIGDGRKRNRIFKWSAIEALIEGRPTSRKQDAPLDRASQTVAEERPRTIDVSQATTNLQRLFD